MCAADCERQECLVNLATSESVLLYHTGRTSTRGAGRTIGRSGGATRFFLHDQQIGAERRPADVGCHHAVRVAQPAPHRQLRKSAETSRRLGRCRSGIGAVAGWRRRWVQQLKSLAKSTKVSFWIKCTRLYPAGPSLQKVPKCLSTIDGTFDLICIRFFWSISPVHSHPLPISCTKGSLIGSRNHMIRSNTNRSKTHASCTKRKSHGINGKRDGSFGTFDTFDTFGQSGVPPG